MLLVFRNTTNVRNYYIAKILLAFLTPHPLRCAQHLPLGGESFCSPCGGSMFFLVGIPCKATFTKLTIWTQNCPKASRQKNGRPLGVISQWSCSLKKEHMMLRSSWGESAHGGHSRRPAVCYYYTTTKSFCQQYFATNSIDGKIIRKYN
jgi:hypothetical protein